MVSTSGFLLTKLLIEFYKFPAVFCSLIFEPVMMYEGKEEASLEQVLSNSESAMRFKDSVYEPEAVKKKLSVTLSFLDQFGLLDEM